MYFNSRPSARGDKFEAHYHVTSVISIHAPPRGATTRHPNSAVHPPYFNSRPSARGDKTRKQKKEEKNVISIHAPPRGATKRLKKHIAPTIFQFTPLREGRRAAARRTVCSGKFQFTPLREGRRPPCISTHIPGYFNSRPSARGDADAGIDFSAYNISIHAPPRGATGNWVRKIKTIDISIHAPPRGATRKRVG